MIRLPPVFTRTDTLFPYTTLFRSDLRQYRLNPPGGFDIHWSRLVDLPIAGLILLFKPFGLARSEEHTSELQSLMRRSYAVFCLKKKKKMKKRKQRTKRQIE